MEPRTKNGHYVQAGSVGTYQRRYLDKIALINRFIESVALLLSQSYLDLLPTPRGSFSEFFEQLHISFVRCVLGLELPQRDNQRLEAGDGMLLGDGLRRPNKILPSVDRIDADAPEDGLPFLD